MIRKTLTILSLIGLLLSVGLWAASYFNASYAWVSVETDVTYTTTEWFLGFGGFGNNQDRTQSHLRTQLWEGFRVEGFAGLATDWLPSLGSFRGLPNMFIPLWIPTLLFAALGLSCRPFHFHRRRKRKRLGLCIKCGYDLRGLPERCPECGTGFAS